MGRSPPRPKACGATLHRRLIPDEFFATVERANFAFRSASGSTLMQISAHFIHRNYALKTCHYASDKKGSARNRWRNLQRSPRPLAGFRGENKGREE